MPAAPLPASEESRLAALLRYTILDTQPEAAFDRLTRLAASLFQVPIALISLVDRDRQWFKSHFGLSETETPREQAFCAYALHNPELLIVPDATQDARFSDNPLVTGSPDIRFYAGAPLRTPDGYTLGTFCVIDKAPRRQLTAEQEAGLEDLARLAMEELERRRHADRVLELERELWASENRFHAFLDHAPAVAFLKDEYGRMVYVNRTFADAFGGEPADYIGKNDITLWQPEIAAELRGNDETLLASGEGTALLEIVPTPDGTVRHWLTHKFPFMQPGGRRFIGGMAVDLTEREQAQLALRRSEERWQLAAQGANDGLFDCDFRSNTVYYSPRWKELLGYAAHELDDSTTTWESLVHPDDKPGVDEAIAAHLDGRTDRYSAEYRMRHKNGTWRWILARGQACWDGHGRAIRLVGSHADMTARKEAEQRLSHEASTDALTGLANRREVTRQLTAAVTAAADWQGQTLALALGDVDHFKQVNDRYGHEAGDEVLAAFGEVLQNLVRKGDLVGRLGGDEFCVILPETTALQAAAIMQRVRSVFAHRQFASSGTPFGVTSTFGIAMWEPGLDARALLARADEALYSAKQRGRNQVHVTAA